MCSMSEDASIRIYKDQAQRQANSLIKHTSKRLVRVFPANMRITSDNFLPYIHWIMGVQMVALNFQTNSTEMLMNHAMFEQTANCGYVKKPECLCDPSLEFDIYSSRVPYRMRVTLKVTVISALFLPVERRSEHSLCHVTLDLFDLPQQERISTSYRVSSTDTAGFHTHFKSRQAIFEKIVMPETAFLQLCVSFSSPNGNPTPPAYYRILSLNRLQNGYRHVILRSIGNRNLGPISLFVHFDIFYYVKKTQISLHSGLMDPFSSERKNESLSQALRYPFMKQDEVEEEEDEEENDDYRQAIVGTTSKRDDDMDQPTPPVSPTADTFTLKMTRKFEKFRKYFK
uniref:Phosphoinositide phospholipase C n=1 Tax=Haemonchus contortus TaxID=6289 RepID=W6NEK3_HAECO